MASLSPIVRGVSDTPATETETCAANVVDLLATWLLRLLIEGRALDAYRRGRRSLEPGVLHLVGLEPWVESAIAGQAMADRGLERALRDRYACAGSVPSRPGEVLPGLGAFGERLNLDQAEQWLLAFVALESAEEALGKVIGLAIARAYGDRASAIALALGLPAAQLRAVMGRDARLWRSGLMYSRGEFLCGTQGTGLEVPHGIVAPLLGSGADAVTALERYCPLAGPSELAAADVPHLAPELDWMSALVGRAAAERTTGVNVLLYGPPGTGKTQLARLVANIAGLRAHEVDDQNLHGRPLESEARASALKVSQHLLAQDGGALVIFDEVEDAFRSGDGVTVHVFASDKQGGKAWTNRMLEENPVPTIWIANSLHRLDRAYLRRFDYVLEVKAPPRSVRQRVLSDHCANLPVSTEWIERIAAADGITPAEIRRAAGVAARVATGDDTEACLETQLDRQARLQGRQLPQRRRGAHVLEWDRTYLNAEPSIEPLLDMLGRLPEAAVLLHGPPGTGKTALAERIAEIADRPLIKRPVSALLSPFLGETEHNIAELFRDAVAEGAVVLLDEADSLLRSRENARARWEVTQTNELLVQIESFPGILICATNHLAALDAAVLRRFDHKIELHPLDCGQRQRLFHELAQSLGTAAADEDPSIAASLRGLHHLTPGDFAAVARRFSNLTAATGQPPQAVELYEALAAESRLKPGTQPRRPGFV